MITFPSTSEHPLHDPRNQATLFIQKLQNQNQNLIVFAPQFLMAEYLTRPTNK